MPYYTQNLELCDESGDAFVRLSVDIDYDYMPGSRGYADPIRGIYEAPEGPSVEVGEMTVRLDDGSAPPLVVQKWIEEKLRASDLMADIVTRMAEEGAESRVEAAEMRSEARAEARREMMEEG